jgi:hypothetical protein
MSTKVLMYIRITKKTPILLNISLEKTIAILASEHFTIYGKLEDIDILETDATVTTLTKVAPFLIFNPCIEFSTFQQFYLSLLHELCQIKNTEDINKDLLYSLVVKVSHIYPGLTEKIDLCLKMKWTNCTSEYTTDSETIFLNALKCVFKYPSNPTRILELANRTRIYDVKKISTDMCMAIHGLEWAINDSVDSFITRHKDSYSIYW